MWYVLRARGIKIESPYTEIRFYDESERCTVDLLTRSVAAISPRDRPVAVKDPA